MLILVFGVACALLVLAYFTYGRYIERKLDVRADRPTPAHTLTDNVDYVPTADPILFGHHFSSIAGAGPIVGPIIAGLAFGWLPALLWIVLGCILIGGVHDFAALMASIRHRGRSIGEVCRHYLSPLTYYLFLTFTWLALIYVIIVFLDLTASTFAPALPELARQGGTVATASVIYIALAIALGFSLYRLKLSVPVATLIFVPLVFGALWFGHLFPWTADKVPAFLGSAKNTWSLVLLVYCFAASITPVWILLQPRDYLSSFLLYACLLAGFVGLLHAGATHHVSLSYPAMLGWKDAQLGFLFPAIFITIACGAVSGFHSLVASGTTAKQLRSEPSARRIAYGGMLTEGVLAVVALATVMILTAKPQGQTPVDTFAVGVGSFVESMGLPHDLATAFALLSVSTFLLTTLDTCTRLTRFIFQELTHMEGAAGRLLGTTLSLLIPAIMVFTEIPGPDGKPMPAWKAIWPAFGASNQLLAALSLLVAYVWLRKTGRKAWYVLIPMVFMLITTVTALSQLAWQNLRGSGSGFVGGISAILAVLALVLLADTVLHLRRTGLKA